MSQPDANPHGFNLDHGSGKQILVHGTTRIEIAWCMTATELRAQLGTHGVEEPVILAAIVFVHDHRVDFKHTE